MKPTHEIKPEMTLNEINYIVDQIIIDGYRSRAAFARAMAMPGVNFTEDQKAKILKLLENGEIAQAQYIILDQLTDGFEDSPG